MRQVRATLEVLMEDNGQWFIRLCADGYEIERWGPYVDETNCFAMADVAARKMREMVALREGEQT